MIIKNRVKTKNVIYKKVYQLWRNMTQRCTNQNNPYYKNYGEKGYKVCDEWIDLDKFIEDIDKIKGFDLEKFLQGKLTLDKDRSNSTVYSLDTCEFISLEENNKIKPNQQKMFIAISPNGEKFQHYNQSEFAKQHNLNQSSISSYLKGKLSKYKGWHFYYID